MKKFYLSATSMAAVAAALSGCAHGLDLKEVNKTLATVNKACVTSTKLHVDAHSGQLGGPVSGTFDFGQTCGQPIPTPAGVKSLPEPAAAAAQAVGVSDGLAPGDPGF